MNISIHQPDYIPYPGFFYKMYQSDVFVFLDDCQFSNDNMHHWNKIKTPQGECRLKIPVKQHLGDNINGVATRDELKWKENHLKTIRMNYSKAKYFSDFYPEFEDLLMCEYTSLAEQNIAIDTFIAGKLGIKPEIYKTSDLKLDTIREQRVIDICNMFKADTYISGNGARAYQEEEHFTKRGVRLVYTDYHPIEYRQLWKAFIPNMSIIDYIFNCGYDFEPVVEEIKRKNRED